MELEQIYDISITEISTENLFYSVISKCKEKGIFGESELVYIDTSLNRMLEETAKFCGKGYIKQETAVIMLKNVFMILDTLYSAADFRKIIQAVKERQLYEMWKRAIFESGRGFDRAQKNFLYLEHFSRKNSKLCADFARRLKDDLALSNIFTFTLERGEFLKEFFSLGERIDYRSLSERSEILCTELGFFDGCGLEEIYPILSDRGSVKREGVIAYTSSLIDSIVISMCFSAFYRCEGSFPEGRLYGEISEVLNGESLEELSETFLSYLHIAAARRGTRIVDKADSVGEGMANLYASRVCEENLVLLSGHLARTVYKERTKDGGKAENLVHFI